MRFFVFLITFVKFLLSKNKYPALMPEDRTIVRIPNSENNPKYRGNNWLLVVGIDKYADPAVPTLRNAVRDTERLKIGRASCRERVCLAV